MSYTPELAAAKKAASLAARLCQAILLLLSATAHQSSHRPQHLHQSILASLFPKTLLLNNDEAKVGEEGKAQNVQKALLLSDVKSKSDKTPVTVADYGSGQLSFAERTPHQHVLTSGGGGIDE
ncbi:hypothetical protein LguiA_003425 [Lonicera macranthoides]